MNTQTHVLSAATLLAKPGEPARNTVVIAGALVPGLAIYTLFAWSKIAGIPERTVWSQLYYQPPWSDAVTVGNSAPSTSPFWSSAWPPPSGCARPTF